MARKPEIWETYGLRLDGTRFVSSRLEYRADGTIRSLETTYDVSREELAGIKKTLSAHISRALSDPG